MEITRLVINPFTKAIAPKHRNHRAICVAKRDHNSVLVELEIPRYVSGYDMSDEKNVVHIHYVNIDGKDNGRYFKGFSDNVTVKTEKDEISGEEFVVLGWLVPKNATRYAGVLSIGVTFERYDEVDGELEETYSWSTAPSGKIIVRDSMDNDTEVIEREYDYLVSTCNAILKSAKESGEFDGEKGASAYDIAVSEGFEGTEKEWLDSIKGGKGDAGDKGEAGLEVAQKDVLIWTNPNPDAEFVGQTIIVPDMSEYTSLKLVFMQSLVGGILPISETKKSTALNTVFSHTNMGEATARSFTISSETAIEFQDAVLLNDGGTANATAIPYKIYGVKNETISVDSFVSPQNASNALKGSVSGEIVSMPDVSPIEHNIGVKVSGKNLFDPAVLDVLGGKYVDGYYEAATSKLYSNFRGDEKSLYEGFEPNTQYTFSVKAYNKTVNDENYGTIGFYFRYADGTISSIVKITSTSEKVLVLTSSIGQTVIGLHCSSVNNSDTVYFKDMQLEFGGVNTGYKPYVPDITAVTLKKCGKNVLKPNFTNGSQSGVTYINNTDGTVTVSGSPTTDAVQFGILQGYDKLPKGTYKFSALPFVTNGSSDLITADIREQVYNETTGLYSTMLSIRYDNGSGVTFNKTKDDSVVRVYIKLVKGYSGDEVTLYPQLEVGTVKTSFETGIEPIVYTPNADGTVDGVKSLYPTTTLLTDTAGVIIEAEYNRDITKTIASLEEKITALSTALLNK